ncbi:MAG: membrane-bound PQQ-dependent dehydrogenase, glucose/quinate/shikimate family [Pusillimonas sp.]|nr:membrane-bound PQQ-dependent dehydrogenase, glucose/quinate/shikimate family [Pusillimonas sp.]
MNPTRRPLLLIVTAIVLLLAGLVLSAGGLWLFILGDTALYIAFGLVLTLVAVLLFKQKALALLWYALLLGGLLWWSIHEQGLDWWPLAARVGLFFVIGLWLLVPWVNRTLQGVPALNKGLLWLALLGTLIISAAGWINDPHRIDGTLAMRTTPDTYRGPDVPKEEWHAYGRTGFGRRYSPLDQITPENIRQLEVAWHYKTGDIRGRPGDPVETTFQVTPLNVGNRLFLCTPHQNVIALDATTGEEIWRFDPEIEGDMALQHLTCRGVSYQEKVDKSALEGLTDTCNSRLFIPTSDGRIIALNPENGEVCSAFGQGKGEINLWNNMPNKRVGGYYSTSPAVVTEDLLIVGGTVLDNVSTNEPSGVIRAFNVNTGELVWNWDAANPEQTEPIAPGQTYTPNSPNSWSISSVDEEFGLLYVPMGNQPPDQWGGNRSPEVEQYSTSIVALELDTGRVRWHFQTVHHDLWDYDVPSQPSLLDLTVNGETVPALVQPTKQGELFVLNRLTGEPVLPVTEEPAPQGAVTGDFTAPTQPVSKLSFNPPELTGADMWGATLFDQLACRIQFHRYRYDGRFTPPSPQGSLIYPGNFGVFNWGSIAVDPQRQVAFTTPTYLAFVSQLVPRRDDSSLVVNRTPPEHGLPALNENFGAPYAVKLFPFLSLLGIPCQAPPWGYVAGADLSTGEIVWKHKNGTVIDSSPLPLPFRMGVPNLGGPLVTAGGVAFLSGTIDNYVRGYDVSTGKQLWEERLPAGGQATPMSFMGRNGKQYLVVVAGGHGSLDTTAGDDVIAYTLP